MAARPSSFCPKAAPRGAAFRSPARKAAVACACVWTGCPAKSPKRLCNASARRFPPQGAGHDLAGAVGGAVHHGYLAGAHLSGVLIFGCAIFLVLMDMME